MLMIIIKMLLCVLFAIFVITTAKDNAAPCVTPNGENATCVSLNSCKPIKQAISSFDENAVEFAKLSQCGNDGAVPFVCCGSVGHIIVQPAHTVASSPRPVSNQEPSFPLHIINPLLPDSTSCGLQFSKNNRIVGGRATEINEYPWMVALKYQKDDGSPGGIRCSGTLLNHRYILTAAQCLAIPGYDLTEVRLGEWRISTEKDCTEDTEDCADPILDLVIIDKLPHPYYDRKRGNNDIALLQVAEKIVYTEFVQPICLPPEDFPAPTAGTGMQIAGWGITENGSLSDVKLKVGIPMVSNPQCAKAYPNATRIGANQACAGGEEGKDACSGDSGGPLMGTYKKGDPEDDEQWFQEGIISRGFGCGLKGIPGLYTRVSRYTRWILTNIKES